VRRRVVASWAFLSHSSALARNSAAVVIMASRMSRNWTSAGVAFVHHALTKVSKKQPSETTVRAVAKKVASSAACRSIKEARGG